MLFGFGLLCGALPLPVLGNYRCLSREFLLCREELTDDVDLSKASS